MAKVIIDYMDGQYSIHEITEDRDLADPRVVSVRDDVMSAWRAHVQQHVVFQELFRMLDNDVWARVNETCKWCMAPLTAKDNSYTECAKCAPGKACPCKE